MNVAIRYQSRGGHVKEIAEIISEGVGVEPISISDPRAPITKHVDVLFLGGALYKFRLDPSMEEFIASIPEGKVRRAIVFGSSALTRRPIFIMQDLLKAKGIDIHPSAIYMRGKPKPYLHEIGVPWAKREVDKIRKEIEEGTYGQEPVAPIVQVMKAHEEKKAKKAAKQAAEVERAAEQAVEQAAEQTAEQEEA